MGFEKVELLGLNRRVSRKERFVTRSADNGTPFFENRFLFETVLDDFSR